MAGLNASDAYIFRITHVQNVPWILANGLHAATGAVRGSRLQPAQTGLLRMTRAWYLIG